MKIGDTVSVLDAAITGVVVSIKNDTIIILTEDDFEMQYLEKELVVMNNSFFEENDISKNIAEIISEKETKSRSQSKQIRAKKRVFPPMEVDLHIHQLVPKSKGLNNYEIITIQLETAKRQLDFAITKKIQRIVFIHGVGEGVLKEELNYLFRRYGNLKYYDADYQKYGVGATEVYIFQNKNP